MDFLFRLPKDSDGNTGIMVFVGRLSKMDHLAAVPDSINGEGTAVLFIDRVFRKHGLPLTIVSYRDPHFTGKFWKISQGATHQKGHVDNGSSADRW